MLPTVFLSHGSPQLALEPGRFGPAWQALAATLPRPAAILAVSAHWTTATPQLGAAATPATLHDFGGFAPALYRLQYPAPGAPALAAQVAARLAEAGFPAGLAPGRGLDHGIWVPLRYLYPQADIPVVPFSVQPGQDADWHLRLGAALAPLRDAGVLLLATGSLTHNLHDFRLDAFADGHAVPYVPVFQEWLQAALTRHDRAALADWQRQAPHARRAHPTPEHLLPLFVAYGAAGAAPVVQRPITGYSGGALAMDGYVFA